jgi:hypothetical protein
LISNKQALVIRGSCMLFNFQRTQKNITSVSCCLCANNRFRESSEEMMATPGSRNVKSIKAPQGWAPFWLQGVQPAAAN